MTVRIKQGFNRYKFNENDVIAFLLKPSTKGRPHAIHIKSKNSPAINYNSMLRYNESFSFSHKRDAEKVFKTILDAQKKKFTNHTISIRQLDECENINDLKIICKYINVFKLFKLLIKS